ncbi:hypothetical protein Tco_0153148 [Tanacetum coccineum]
MEQELWTSVSERGMINRGLQQIGFHELRFLMCPELMTTEAKKIGKYIRWVYLKESKGNMISSKLDLA